MQLATETATSSSSVPNLSIENETQAREARYGQYKVIRRNGAVVSFEPGKISVAMTKAFLAVNGSQGAASARVREQVAKLTESVVSALMRRQPGGGTLHIEDIQDQVELALMRSGEHDVARAYVLYREERARLRAQQKAAAQAEAKSSRHQRGRGRRSPAAGSGAACRALVKDSCEGLGRAVDPESDPPEHSQGPLRRRADGRGAQVRDPVRPRPDREGSRLQLRHRAAATQ